jgi:hypothetical protein
MDNPENINIKTNTYNIKKNQQRYYHTKAKKLYYTYKKK